MENDDKKVVKPSPPKQLSGAIRDMRFMKRLNKAVESHQARVENHVSPAAAHPNHPLSDGDSFMQDAPPDETTASPADMYGIAGHIVGRRSFGGKNQHVSKIYDLSYSQFMVGKKQMKVSDAELLQRYSGSPGTASEHSKRRRPQNSKSPVQNKKVKNRK